MAALVPGPRARSLALVLVTWLLTGIVAAAQAPAEYQVKAAYLFGFGRFVEWPAAAVENSPFTICVLGDDPMGHWLDDVASTGTIRNRPVRVQRLTDVEGAGGCQMVFISASEELRLARIFAALQSRPVLTVSDLPQFVQRGGMVGFVMAGSRVRFAVNVPPAQAAGLSLSPELLRVATTVVRGGQR